MRKVIHIISLNGRVGGVQQAFSNYFKFAQKYSNFKHCIFTKYSIDKKWGKFDNSFNIKFSFLRFIYYIFFQNSIIYLHNKLSSISIFYLLKFLPTKNILYHEHGLAWNIRTKQELKRYQKSASLVKKIIVNSIATKSLLIKKFKIKEDKLELAYYGYRAPKISKKIFKNKKKKVYVGFIGRFEIFKGIHSLIEAANLLRDKNIEFHIGGDGYLAEDLKKLAKENKKIKFKGEILNPINFIKTLDILVVPSIREPLGLVNIEAGLCKVPVIASNVDGIPEVIKNNFSGILINPNQKLSLKNYESQAPLPDFVINPKNYELKKPKEINPKLLSKSILYLSSNKNLRHKYGKQLHKIVKAKFTIKNYFKKIENIYQII